MVTSRFHKDEAVLQRDTMMAKVRSRRNIAMVAEVLGLLALFFVLWVYAGPMDTSPLYLPLYPAIVALLVLGAALMGTGAYFKRRLYALNGLAERPAVRKRYTTTALVQVVLSLMLALVFLIAMPPFGDTNLAEQGMLSEKDRVEVGSNTYIRIQFTGADTYGSFRAELSVTSTNNLTLDFYLLEKADADAFDPAAPPADNISYSLSATSYTYKGDELGPQQYTLVISNAQNDTAILHYKVFQRTNDQMSLVFILFFLVYVGIAGGWAAHVRSWATTETVPVIEPPVPSPVAPRPAMPGPPQPGAGMQARGMPPSAAGQAPETGGVPMSITCPRCNTVFEVMRGAGPTKIKCPGCGKEGTLAGLPTAALEAARAQQAAAGQAPAPVRAAPPAGGPAYQQPAPEPYMEPPPEPYLQPPPEQYAQPAPEQYARPAPGSYAPAVPAAGDMYARPAAPPAMTARPAPPAPAPPQPSPYDQLKAMGLAPPEPAIPEAAATPLITPPAPPRQAAPAPVQMKTIACPRCKQAFQIDKVEGPQHIRCPHCGKEGTIGAKKPAAVAAPPAVPPAAGPPPAGVPVPRPAPAAPAAAGPAAAPKMISCPACKRPFPVAETRRPVQVKCPSCGKEGVLRK